MEKYEHGYEEGELCNRGGCCGIIERIEKDGCCSCHINPPCGYCTDPDTYCPECNWEYEEEYIENNALSKEASDYYKRQSDILMAQNEEFYEMYCGKKPSDKLVIRRESHTYFTMKVRGVFPKGTESKSSLLKHIDGTFGGRYVKFNDYSFEYIAYTN